ncbi:hypothetical protein CC1G_15771 [Coprinopsis cinerea okayama7|uniref:Uncharacterized protein n=1 Tax=Coprinopsis cinerea (strain Okayama-7 / 130 / ATCC MYA-4618 / FGSC 9003) TaxID=240176 RepID=D6RR15_COPC7|nr:hypothetical protein CC1G_15771 [Coprinopsis cinerea okayama7\|eukprot:XP_002910052.1 hypothetical protein CC1G_15771 [Coprinopsis cinerea okayama7\
MRDSRNHGLAPQGMKWGTDLLPGDANGWATRPIKRQRMVQLSNRQGQRTPPAREMETLPPIVLPSVPPMHIRRSATSDPSDRKFRAGIDAPQRSSESKGHAKAKRGTKRRRDGSPVQKAEKKDKPAQSTGPVKRWRCPWGKGCSFTTDNPKQVWPYLDRRRKSDDDHFSFKLQHRRPWVALGVGARPVVPASDGIRGWSWALGRLVGPSGDASPSGGPGQWYVK